MGKPNLGRKRLTNGGGGRLKSAQDIRPSLHGCPVPRSRITLLVLVAVGFAVGAGTLTGRWLWTKKKAPSEQPQVALFIDPQDLDLGEVWETDRFIQKVTVYNRGSE